MFHQEKPTLTCEIKVNSTNRCLNVKQSKNFYFINFIEIQCIWWNKSIMNFFHVPWGKLKENKLILFKQVVKGFPGSSAGKESTCNAGDPGLIPGLGRPPGEGKGHPLQYSWASLVAQLVKMLETWVQSLGWEDPLEEGMQPTPIFLPGESPWTEEPGGLQSMGSWRVGHDWTTKHSTSKEALRNLCQNMSIKFMAVGTFW